MVPHDELHVVTGEVQHAVRTEAGHLRVLSDALALTSAPAIFKACQSASINPVMPGLVGFAHGDTDWGSSTMAYGHEGMHVEDSGVFLTLVKAISPYLRQVHTSGEVAELEDAMNERLQAMPRSHDRRYPSCNYFPEPTGKVQATEHRAVTQALPFILNGINQDLCELATVWVIGYKLRYSKGRSPELTAEDCEVMRRNLARFGTLFNDRIAPLLPSKGNFIKLHRLNHIVDDIQRTGNLLNIHAQHWEASHKNTKDLYKHFNRQRSSLNQMVALGRLRAAAQRMDQVDLGSSAAPYHTMFKRVVETGRPALAANGVTVQLSELVGSTHNASHRQPELELLPAKLKEFGEAFLPGVALPWGITLVQSAALPAKAEDADMCEVVTVHATPAYYNGRPWYSNVAVDVAEEGGGHATIYAQLRLLFWWGEHELAFIRWYQLLPAEVQEEDYLASQGNPLVCWEHPAYQHPSITAAKGKRRKPQTRRRHRRGHGSDRDSDSDINSTAAAGYCVIPLASILRDEELVPNWANKDSEQYYVSGLSWRKHSPDIRTIPQKMATSKHAKRYRYDQGIITEQASG